MPQIIDGILHASAALRVHPCEQLPVMLTHKPRPVALYTRPTSMFHRTFFKPFDEHFCRVGVDFNQTKPINFLGIH